MLVSIVIFLLTSLYLCWKIKLRRKIKLADAKITNVIPDIIKCRDSLITKLFIDITFKLPRKFVLFVEEEKFSKETWKLQKRHP